jgi:hypothetical protein
MRVPFDDLGRDCPSSSAPRRSAAVNGQGRPYQGRKRASRAAIDGENGVASFHIGDLAPQFLLFDLIPWTSEHFVDGHRGFAPTDEQIFPEE